MKMYIENYKALPWYGKILAIPGLLFLGMVCLVLSPFFFVMAIHHYASQVMGWDDHPDIWL